MNNTNQTDATVLTTVQQAIAAAQAGNKPLARLHLENAVTSEHENPDYWVWLAWTAESPISSISALQHALSLDPEHALAKQGLDWALAMRDFDLLSYRAPRTDTSGADSSGADTSGTDTSGTDTSGADSSGADSSAKHEDDGFGTEALELPAEEAPQAPQAEAEEPATTTEVEEPLPAEEPVVEVEEVDEPVIVEPADELDADGETIEEPTAESAEVLDEVSPVNEQTTEQTTEGEVEAEPLDAELVDVREIKTEVLLTADDLAGDARNPDGPITVLAVDDSPTIRKIVSMSLEGVGYKVVTAADGMEAMQKLPKCHPSLILTDISMPKIDGYQLCKLIKAHENTKAIPVIMLSGKDGMFDKIKGKFVGCDDYITKPFQSAELLEKVSSYLPAPVSDS